MCRIMKKILITGGAGFIGSWIVNQLFNNGKWEITVLDNLTEQIHGSDWQNSYLYKSVVGKCHFIRESVCNLSAVQQAVCDCEYIIHLAAETGTGQSMYLINQYNSTNIMGTSNILQAISLAGKKNKVKKIILSSSRSVYGEGKYLCPQCGVVYPNGRSKEKMLAGDFAFYCPHCGSKMSLLPTTEDSDIKPASLYAFTKYAQEMMLKTMCPAMGIDYTIFRFQNVYGVGQSLKNPYTGILSVFSTLMLENKPVNIFEDGLESRDFINVKDVARGVICSLENECCNGETINIGSGINTSVIEIATMLKKYYDSESDLTVTGDFRIGDIAHNKADISKAQNILGFVPKINLSEGLKEFCSWVISQDKDGSRYEKSLCEMENAGMFIRKS
ncbi:MAG: NAD-dependent epimerase/dehydratase family protein [Lachnospiraceae bacterium]|nr:NAD-dependent epimerase/dehydratase family protein [Lachnospiraceae bacterium]